MAEAEAAADDDGAVEHPCPVCLDNADDASVIGSRFGMCSACGQMYCGACHHDIAATLKCPTCRATLSLHIFDEFKRLWKLVHDRSPGRHTPIAQNQLGMHLWEGTQGPGASPDKTEAIRWYRIAAEQGYALAQFNLGSAYDEGDGVQQDFAEALKWFQLAAEQGHATAQYNLGIICFTREGVAHDFAGAAKWFQLAAQQGYEDALYNIDIIQQDNLIPTPPPGTNITTVLLTSAAGAKYNNKAGKVVTSTARAGSSKPGRVPVLLEGEANPISFKLMNLRIHVLGIISEMDGAQRSSTYEM